MLLKYKKKLKDEGELYFRVKARPGANETKIKGVLNSEKLEIIKIDVAGRPEKDKANQELIRFLAEEFAVSPRNVKIVSGANDKLKLVNIIK